MIAIMIMMIMTMMIPRASRSRRALLSLPLIITMLLAI